MLDTHPFGGGVTSLDAFHVDLPVITMPAAQSIIRQARAYYIIMGMGVDGSGCVADTEEQYVEKAVAVAQNREGVRDRIRQAIEVGKRTLFEDPRVLEEWERFLIQVAISARKQPAPSSVQRGGSSRGRARTGVGDAGSMLM